MAKNTSKRKSHVIGSISHSEHCVVVNRKRYLDGLTAFPHINVDQLDSGKAVVRVTDHASQMDYFMWHGSRFVYGIREEAQELADLLTKSNGEEYVVATISSSIDL